MGKLVFAGFACALTGLAGFWLGRPRGDIATNIKTKASLVESAKAVDGDATPEIARLERRIELLEAKQSAAEIGNSKSTAVPTEQSPAMIPDLEESRERDSSQTKEIEKRLSTESRDRTWASSAEDQLRHAAKIAAGDAGSYSISRLTCLTSICRINLSVPGLASAAGTLLPFNVEGMAGYRTTQPEAGRWRLFDNIRVLPERLPNARIGHSTLGWNDSSVTRVTLITGHIDLNKWPTTIAPATNTAQFPTSLLETADGDALRRMARLG